MTFPTLPGDLGQSLSFRQYNRSNAKGPIAVTHPTIHKVLEISTCHLMPATLNGWLKQEAPGRPSSLIEFEYGWFVQAHYLLDQLIQQEVAMPADLEECCRFAQDNGCLWIMFDADAAMLEQLTDYSEAYA